MCDRRKMIGGAAAVDALMVPADIGGVRRDVGDAGILPERDLAPPILFAAGTGGYPHLQPDLARVAPSFPGKPPQFLEGSKRLVAGRIPQRHEAVAVFGRTAERCLGMAAEPDRHSPGYRPRVDAGILD